MKSSHALLAFGAAICLATTCSLSAYASPLKNYDAGKVAIDAGITLPSSLKGDTINSANPTVPILAQLSASAKKLL